MGSTHQGFSLALTLGAGYLDVGDGGCFEFEFLTEGPWHERKAANNCGGLCGRKTDSKPFCVDRTDYVMGGNDGLSLIADGSAPEGSYFSSLGQLFCEREQCT